MTPVRCVHGLLLLMVLGGMAACRDSSPNGGGDKNQASVPTESATSPLEGDASQSSSESEAIAPGDYCFAFNDGVTDSTVRLTIASDNTITGSTAATIQDVENSYFTSYEQAISGTIAGRDLNLDVTTSIELDIQKTKEIWQLTGSTLNNGRETFDRVDCSALAPLDSSTSDQPLPPNNASNTPSEDRGLAALGVDPSAINGPVRVQFAPGTDSAVLENAVIRGTRDLYLLGAQAGQSMRITLTSIENNAVLDILAPNGDVLYRETIAEEFALPETGDYQIVVGGTRGNATYQLAVSIQ